MAEYGLTLGLLSVLGFIGFMSVIAALSATYGKIAYAIANSAKHAPAVTTFFP